MVEQTKTSPAPAKRPSTRRKKSLYASALTEAERVMLSEARQVEGLDEEIALLRVRLARMLAEHPENSEVLLKSIGMLVRAVSTKYRLSRQSKEDLAGAIDDVLKGIGGALWPDVFPPEG